MISARSSDSDLSALTICPKPHLLSLLRLFVTVQTSFFTMALGHYLRQRSISFMYEHPEYWIDLQQKKWRSWHLEIYRGSAKYVESNVAYKAKSWAYFHVLNRDIQ